MLKGLISPGDTVTVDAIDGIVSFKEFNNITRYSTGYFWLDK